MSNIKGLKIIRRTGTTEKTSVEKDSTVDLFGDKKSIKDIISQSPNKNKLKQTTIKLSKKDYTQAIKDCLDLQTKFDSSIKPLIDGLPITSEILQYIDDAIELIPLSGILLSIISKYALFNSSFRTAVSFGNNIITPNLYTLLILKSGYGKDKTDKSLSNCFQYADIELSQKVQDIYKTYNTMLKQAKKNIEDEDDLKYLNISNPDCDFNMSKSTFEGFHKSILDMNVMNFGTLRIKSGEFFDSVINSKTSSELVESVKDCYYHGAKISKTIKSQEFKTSSTVSPAITATFHSAMELNDHNKEKVIDFAKNGLGRRLLISMSDNYRHKYMNPTEINLLDNTSLKMKLKDKVTVGWKHYMKIYETLDYENDFKYSQKFTRVLSFDNEAMKFLVDLHNFYMQKLEEKTDDSYIVVLEQTIKIALNLHLIEEDNDEISLKYVEIAFVLFLLFNHNKVKYENILFGTDEQEAMELLYNTKMNKTDFFQKGLKKTRWSKKRKDEFLVSLDDYVKEQNKELLITTIGKTTHYSVVDIESFNLEDTDEN